MNKSLLVIIVSLWFVVLGVTPGIAQEPSVQDTPPPTSRKKIAIVLAGGGALGISHIGVLKWFEEHHIPIDYVAGTSIGGLIGGAYASGLTPGDMQKLIFDINWRNALGSTPYELLPFRRKEDQRAIPTVLKFGLRGSSSLGLTPAQPIGALFSRISLPYSTLASFDDLPIPFRCVATDLNDGTSVVLKDGPLNTALRATMAIPGVFTPIERNGRLLADGSLLQNLPTEVAKEMGADIIIAIDLGATEGKRPRATSVLDVLNQSQALVIRDNERRSLRLANIVIAPDLKGMTLLNFEPGAELIKRGYEGAEASKASLLPLALNDADWADYLANREARHRRVMLIPHFIKIVGVTKEDAKGLEKTLLPFIGQPLDTEKLEAELYRLTGEGRFENLLYERTEANGEEGLLIQAQQEPFRSAFLNFGIVAGYLNQNEARSELQARATVLDAGSFGAEIRANVSLSANVGASIEYYHPLHNSRLFLAPNVFTKAVRRNVYQDGSRIATFDRRSNGLLLDAGYAASNRSQIRLGYGIGYLKDTLNTGVALQESISGQVQLTSLRWTYDGQDSPVIPTYGTYSNLEANWYTQAPEVSEGLPRVQLQMSHFKPVSVRGSVFGAIDMGTTFGKSSPSPLQFTLGGPLRLTAFNQDEFQGDSYSLLTVGYLHRLVSLPPPLGNKIVLGGWYEYGGVSETFRLAKTNFRNNASLALIAETGIGPMIIGASMGDAGRKTFFIALGPLF